MNCSLETIHDEKLKILVSHYGADKAMSVWIEEYSKLLSKFERDVPISGQDAISILNDLEAHNSNNNTNHIVDILDGGKSIESSKIDPNGRYTTSLRLGWGKSISKLSALYAEGVNGGNKMFDDDGEYIEDNFIEPDPSDFDDFDDFDDSDIDPEPDYSDLDIVIEDDFTDMDPEDIDDSLFGTDRVRNLNATQRRVLNAISYARKHANSIRESIDKLMKNKNDIDAEIAALEAKGVTGKELDVRYKRIVLIMHKINDYRSELESIQSTEIAAAKAVEVDGLRELYMAHMKFVNIVSEQEYSDDLDLNLAESIISMWSSLYDIMTDDLGSIDPGLEELLTQINSETSGSMRYEITRKLKTRVLGSHSKYIGRKITETDLTYAKDVGKIAAGATTLSDTRIPILNMIGSLIAKMKSMVNTEELSVIKRISKLFENMSSDYSQFLEYDDDGKFNGKRVGRFNNKYYTERDAIMNAFSDEIKRGSKYKHSKVKEEREQRNKILRDAILMKNKNLLSGHIVIDPALLEDQSGIDKLIQDIYAETGDMDYAKDRVDDALAKWSKYKRDKTVFTAYTNDTVHAGRLSMDDAARKIAMFEKYNSPKVFYDHLIKTKIENSDIMVIYNSPYSTMIPRKNYFGTSRKTDFYSGKFADIMKDEKTKKFYNEFNNIMAQMISYLPSDTSGRINANFLPNIQKDFWSRVSKNGMTGIMSGVNQSIVDAVTSSNLTDSQYGRRDEKGRLIRRVPIRFISPIAAEDKSTDLKAVLTEFARMAIGYKYATMVEDKVAVEMKVLRSMKAANTRRDGTVIKNKAGDVDASTASLDNANAMAQHFVDSNLYGSTRDIEGFTNHKFFDGKKSSIKVKGSVNPVPILKEFEDLKNKVGAQEAATKIKELYPENVEIVTERQAYKDLQQKLDDLDDSFYSKSISEDEYKIKTAEIEDEMAKLGRNNVISKWIDQIINFAAYKAFAWNPFPVVTNQSFGVITILNHAAGGEDFGVAEAVSGLRIASSSSISVVRSRNTDNDKIYNLAKKFRVISDITEGKSSESTGLMRVFGPFGLLSSSDYINRSAVMVAMLKSAKITDKTGATRLLIDAYNNDGSWNYAEFGENTDWNVDPSVDNSGSSLFKFEQKLRKINRRLHGNMDAETSPSFKRNAVGRLLSQYRLSWMVEGVLLRFEGRRYDEDLERNVEGRYITGFNYFIDNGLMSSMLSMLKYMAFQGNASFDGMRLRRGDKELVMANMKKNFHELFTWCALMGVYFLLAASVDDDDEDRNAKYVILNSLNRIMGDITFYVSPMTFNQIVNNPVPAFSIFTDAIRLQKTIVKHMNGDDYYDNEVLLENFTRNFPGLNVYNKIKYRSERILQNQ